MTEDEPIAFERPHRFALGESLPLQAIVRRIGVGDEALVGDPINCKTHAEFFSDLSDFSCKGLKLTLPFQAQFQERLAFRMELSDVDYFFESEATVRNIRVDGDRWVAGCSINPPLPQFLVDYLAHTAGKDRRRTPRVAVTGNGFFKREGDTLGSPAEFINLSEGGFCAKTSEMPLLGERVKFLVYDKARNLKQVTTRVRWTRPVENENANFVGLSFVEKSGYKVMKSALLISNTDVPILVKRDFIAWYVIAACVLCMIIPPLSSIAIESASRIKQSTGHDHLPAKPHPIRSSVIEPVTTSGEMKTGVISKQPSMPTTVATEPPFESQLETIKETSPFLMIDENHVQPFNQESLPVPPAKDISSRRGFETKRP